MVASLNLLDALQDMDAQSAVAYLANMPDTVIAEALHALGPSRTMAILERFSSDRRHRIAAVVGEEGQQWLADRTYVEGSVGRLMERPAAAFLPTVTIRDAIDRLRAIVSHTLVTYIYVVNENNQLIGVATFRELTFAHPEQTLAEIMLPKPFALDPNTDVIAAMREVVLRHYPVYPVCDTEGHLIGIVRGSALFEQQAFDISAQAGAMVGVEKEERLATPWQRSFKYRHPWLQLNLLTAFAAAVVVGLFQNTINHLVLLAVFLPVLSGQCSNTGCQALAVTLRGITLGEFDTNFTFKLLIKEAWLGFLNGVLTGVVAAAGMFAVAYSQQNPHTVWLASITWAAMTISCTLSGIAGAAVPLLLKRIGTDPATASSIFLTTATDAVSMGLFLGLATWLIHW